MKQANARRRPLAQSIAKISAETANAIEKLQRSEDAVKAAKDLLIMLQLELEQLYILYGKTKK